MNTSSENSLIYTDPDIDIINQDHEKLFETLKRVRKMENPDNDPVEIGAVLAQLYEYTSEHFQREEDIMDACNYPQLIAHQKAHEKLEKMLDKILNEQSYVEANNIHSGITRFLEEQLVEHVLTMDKSFLVWKQQQATSR